jgi:hypothetical protein
MGGRVTVSLQAWKSSLVSSWDSLRSTYWALPMLMTASAAGLALAAIELDARTD